MASASGGVSTSSSSVVDRQAEEFKALRQPFADVLSTAFPQAQSFLAGGLNFGEGGIDLDQYRTPFGAGERRALEGLEGFTTPTEGDILSDDLLNRTLSGDFLSVGSNPGLRDLINYTNQEINRAYNAEGLEQKSLFARAGQVLPESSPFAEAAGKLSASRLDAIGRNTAELTSRSFEAERDRQVQAIEQRRSDASFEFNRQLEFLKASALPRLIDEIGFDRAFDEYQLRIQAISQALGLTAGIAVPALGVESRSKSINASASYGGTTGGYG